MKSNRNIFIFSILIISSILLLGFFIKSFLQTSTSELNKKIYIINSAIITGDWTAAHKASNSLVLGWHKTEPIWALFINHHEIDNITSSLLKAAEYINFNDNENASVYLSELQEFLKHIPDMEKLSLKNIL